MYHPPCNNLCSVTSFRTAHQPKSDLSLRRIIGVLGLCAGLLAAIPAWAQPVQSVVSSYAGSGAGDWSNPGNVIGPADNNCANMGAVNKANLTYNFDFNIPVDATITAITAFIKAGATSDQNIGVQLASNASVQPSTKIGIQRTLLVPAAASGACSVTTVASLGTTLADWGLGSLSPTLVNSMEFGLVFTKLQTSTLKVDSICLQIGYETVDGPSVQQECFAEPPVETNTITIVKDVEGTPPGTPWDFSGSGDIGGAFQLAAEGGFLTAEDLADDTYIITETPKSGYTVTSECFIDDVSVATGDDEISVAVAGSQFATCVFTNTLNSGTFTVSKDFSDDSVAEVSIELTCSDGNVTENPLTATEASPAVFEVTGFSVAPTCTATETVVPAGYTMDDSDCQDNDPLDGGSCTIVNTLRTANFTVNKTYDDSATDAVTINLVCADGDVTTNDLSADPSTPAVFEVTGFEADPNCTATESGVPAGYTADNTDCVDVALVADGECTIANTANTGTFTVRKVYTGGTENPVSVTASCTSPAMVTNNPQMASPSASAIFNVTRVVAGVTTCTASEVVPAGFEADESDCQDGDPIDGGCTITNSPVARATFRVIKDFTDDNPSEVTVALDCTTGLILDQDKDISEGDDVVFVVTDYDPGELNCDISEVIPEGYSPTYNASILSGDADAPTSDALGCYFDNVVNGEFQCLIVNTPDPVDVVIEKVWVIEGSGGNGVDTSYELELFCDAEIVGGNTSCGYSYKNGEAASSISIEDTWCDTFYGDDSDIFTGQVIPEYPDSKCWVRERVYDDAVEIDNDCQNLVVSAGNGDSCVITNTVFFEGIPTLDQYGKAMLVLLMLGMGIVGFRRFS